MLVRERSNPWSATRKNQFPAPGDIAGETSGRDASRRAVGEDIADTDPPVFMQDRRDRSHRSLDPVFARSDAAEMAQGLDDADGAVTAHAEESDIVEEGDLRGAVRIVRLLEEGSDDDLVSAWLAEDRPMPPGEIGRAQAAEDDSGRFATGVGIDHGKTLHFGMAWLSPQAGRFPSASRMIFRTRSRSSPARGRRGSRTHSLPSPFS